MVNVENSREDPTPVGDAVTVGEWTVRVKGVLRNADALVESESQFNDPPRAGHQYILVNLDATYNGTGSRNPGRALSWAAVSDDGTLYEPRWAVIPEDLYDVGKVPSGVKATGNILLEVPTTDAPSVILYLVGYSASWDLEGTFLALP